MIFWKSIRTALFLFSVRCLSAQDYHAEILHYGVENGLSHREVEVVFQDRDGFIWLGTRFGLNRFDGYTFQSWTRPQYGLNFNDISRIFQDDAGWLWLYNSDRAFVFLHPHTGELRTTEQLLGAALPFKTSPDHWQYDPRSPAADSMGRLHFITHDLEFIYTSKAGFQQQTRPFSSVTLEHNLQTLSNPARQSSWELQADGWHIFDQAHRLQLTLLRSEQPADLFTPNCMYADRQGRVWLGGDFGLTMIDVQPVHFQRYFSFSGNQQKPFNNSARGIWADAQSIYANFEMGGWVKMPRHPSPSAPPWKLLDRTKDVPDRFVSGLHGYWGRPLLRDAEGHFWIGADHSLRQLDSTGRLLNKYTFEQDPAADFWSIHPDRNGRIWLGYAKGLAYKDPTDHYIRRLAGLPGMDTFPSTLVLSMVEDRENQLWLCTNRGLYGMNTANNTAIRYSSRDTGRCWLPADDFQHLHQDKDGVYWLATAGQGLIRWDRRTGQIQRITQAKGLSSDNIYAVYEDAAQGLWLSSDYGIMQLEKSSLRVRIYLPKDGLAQEEFNRIAHFQAADGTIFMGGLNGITAFNPADFYLTNTAAAAPLCITSLKQFNRKRELIDRTGDLWQNAVITIAPEEEFFQLEFVLLAFENIEKIRYAWKIEGVDADWNYQAERSIRLSRLPFGTHTLRIKAQLANGQPAANELTFTIVVLRPFYLSFWFFTLLTILLMFGSYSWYAWRLQRLRQRQQDLEAAIQQATAQIQQDKAVIEQQANELRQLDQMKSRFFTNVSHELRTPLTLILGPIGTVLNSAGLTEGQINLLQKTRESGRALLKLVNNLLDLAKMEQDKLGLQVSPEPLFPLLQNVVAPYENYAQQLGIQLILDYQAKPDLQLAIDRDKLETILNNLISNALKFTLPGGSVTLGAEDHDPVMRLLVQDTGTGIHPDDLPHIFKRFYQSPVRPAQSSSDYLAGGTGIGLALSQELAQALGGRLWAESVLEQGSTFYLEFPKQEVTSLAPAAQPEAQPVTNLPVKSSKVPAHSFIQDQHAARLLLVEDNGELRDYLSTILSPYYEVVTAMHGQAALDLLAQGIDFQMIISDIMMPVMDGFQLIERLKARAEYRHIPIILLTARAELEDKLRALRIGVDDYLLKPFEEAELLARIENLLAHAQQRAVFQQTEPDPETPPAASPAIPTADQQWLERLENVVRQHLADPQFTTEFVAEKMTISRRQLQRRLQQLVGLSPHAYIQEIRLHEARHLLEKRAFKSVKEVARVLGYPNTEYFSRQFRGRFGKVPSEYLV